MPSEAFPPAAPEAQLAVRNADRDARITREVSQAKAIDGDHYMNEGRLQRVTASITAMGLSRRHSRSLSEWVSRATGVRPEVQTEQMLREWAEVFIQHNELFRGSSARPGQFSLIARRAVDRVSGTLDDHADRPPLTEAVLKLLIETAIAMHGAQLSRRADRRWGLNLMIPFSGGLLGALLGAAGALLKS
jgi:hypothetical protein